MAKGDDFLLDHVREQYASEFGRRDALDASLTLPIGVLTVEVGAAIYLTTGIGPLVLDWLHWVLYGSGVAFLVTLVISGYFLVRAMVGVTYAYISTARDFTDYATELETHNAALRKYNEGRPCPLPEVNIEERIHQQLRQQYADCATRNSQSNMRRRASLYRCKLLMVCSVAMLMVAWAPFAVLEITSRTAEVLKVQVVQ